MPSARSACASSFSPSSCDSACASVLRWWRILERARPVRTKPSQAGLGVETGAVTTSTTSPFFSSVRSGTCSPLMLAADGAVADVAVDGVGEVDHRRAARQRHDLALGREHVDRVGEQVDLDVVPELGGVARLVLDVQQRLQPLGAQALGAVAARVGWPCTASAPPRRTRPPRAWPRCASGTRRSRPTGRPAWCAATGSR